MSPWIFIPLVAFVAALFLLSWRECRRGRRRAAVLLLLAGAFLLRAAAAADPLLHPWDERYHALVARNLAAHPLRPTLYERPALAYDYRDWCANHVWLHKPPLPLWAISAAVAVGGARPWVVRLPSVLVSTLAVWCTFLIAAYLFSVRAAWLAAFLQAINGWLVEMAAGRAPTDHIDVFFQAVVNAALCCAVLYLRNRRPAWQAAVGLCLGAALLCKWLTALIILPLWLLLVWPHLSLKRIVGHGLVIALIALALYLPWQLYIFRHFPLEAGWESAYNVQHLFHPLEGHAGGPFFHWRKALIFWGELLFLPLLWYLWRGWRERRPTPYWMPAVWFLVPYAVFSLAATKMPAYVLFTGPAAFLMTAHAWDRWRDKAPQLESVPRLLLTGLLALLLLLPMRFSLERLKPWLDQSRQRAAAERLHRLAARVDRPDAVAFNVREYIEVMFHSAATVYPFVPDSAQIESVRRQGRSVYVLDDGTLPDALRARRDVVFLRE